jgi:hypothetical protein
MTELQIVTLVSDVPLRLELFGLVEVVAFFHESNFTSGGVNKSRFKAVVKVSSVSNPAFKTKLEFTVQLMGEGDILRLPKGLEINETLFACENFTGRGVPRHFIAVLFVEKEEIRDDQRYV